MLYAPWQSLLTSSSLNTHQAGPGLKLVLTLFSLPNLPLLSHLSCLTTETHWYSGEDCNQGIQKSLVYGLVGAGVVLVLIILVALLMLLFHSKREVKR